jgi:predicted PolB exonuclease-like 3'-5' exonuclease
MDGTLLHSRSFTPAHGRPLLVLDLETVPDSRFHDGEAFPKPLHHQVIAIACLAASFTADDDGEFLQIDGLGCCGDSQSPEQDLIAEIFGFIEEVQPRIVTFNGRGFDLPVLRYRAMQYGISAPWFSNGVSRWENYDQRYRPEWHFDLMDGLSGFGASKAASLNEACQLLSIPCKPGFGGADVLARYQAGKIDEIREYAKSDVMATHALFLKYALFRGELDRSGYERSVDNLTGLQPVK